MASRDRAPRFIGDRRPASKWATAAQAIIAALSVQ